MSTLTKDARRSALVLAFGLMLLHMPSGLPAPLYPVYQATLGITAATVSMLFATYVLGTLVGLMVMPRIVHFRYVLVWACALSIVADVMFLYANGAFALFAGHFVQGVVLGVFTGAVPVLLAQLDLSNVNKTVGRFTTSANAVGLAAGPLWSGLLLEFAPWKGQLVWVVQIVATLAVMPFMRVPAGLSAGAGEQASIGTVVKSMLSGVPGRIALLTGFCAFASGGLLASLGSVVLESIVGVRSGGVQGFLVALCFILSAIFGAVHLKRSDLGVTGFGLVFNAVGSLALVGGVVFSNIWFIVAAAILCGIGQGFGLQGATQLVAVHADDASRGKAISLFFIWCYLGTTIASFGVGGLITLVGLGAAFNGFAALVAVLSLFGLLWGRSR